MPRLRDILRVGLVISIATLATGCVTSEKSQYADTLSATIAARPSSNDTVAMTFGLDQYERGVLASAER